MANDPHHPALRTKHIHAERGLFESSANMDIRIIWHYQETDAIALLDVGHHDILKKY
jgi:mRNA-degrading endonuclease YafQ of YafQ-DinJ toxin-antitoxin module